MKLCLSATLLGSYAAVCMFEQFVVHSYVAIQHREIRSLFEKKLLPEQLSRFDWALGCKIGMETMVWVALAAGLFIAVLVYFYVVFATRDNSDEGIPFRLRQYSPVVFFLYMGILVAFSYADPHMVMSLVDIALGVGFAGVLTASVAVFLNFSRLPRFRNEDVEMKYLQLRMAHAHQMLHHTIWAFILTMTGLVATSYIQEFMSVPLEVSRSREYGFALSSGAIQLMTLLVGGELGIIDRLFKQHDIVLKRFQEIAANKTSRIQSGT